MAENTIERVIKIDTAGSDKTVRELTAEVEQARKKLEELQAGADGYAAAAERAAAAEQQLSDAMTISKTSTQAELKSVAELSEMVEELTSAKGDLIQQMIKEQDMLKDIESARKSLNKAIEENRMSEEAAATQKARLLELETQYQTSLAQTQSALKTVEKQIQVSEDSYDQMSQMLGRLRDEYRQLSEAQQNSIVGEDLHSQIQSLDAELKNINASMASNHQDVSSYQGGIDNLIPGFSRLAEGVKNLSGGTLTLTGVIQGGTSALKVLTSQALAFIATPLGAAIMAIVVAYKALKSGIDELNTTVENNVTLTQMQEKEETKMTAWQIERQKANEETAKSWITIKGVIGEAYEAYKTLFIYASTNQWGKLWDVITGVGETKKALANIEDLKKELHEMQVGDPDNGRLGSIEQIGKIEREITQLKEKAADGETYSNEEREEALRQAVEKNKELYAIKRQELQLQLKIAETQHQASPDNAQFQKEWANLRKMMEDLDAQEANAQKNLINGITNISQTAQNEAQKVADERAKAAKEAAEKAAQAAKEAAEATENTIRNTLKIQQRLREETLENELQTAKENYEQNLADFNKTVKEKKISEEAAANYRKALAEQNEADIAEIRKKYRDKEHEELVKAWEEEQKQTQQQQEIAKKTLELNMGDLDRNAARETAEAKRDIDDPQVLEQELQDIQQRLYEAKIALIDEMLNDPALDFDTIKELSDQRADLEIKNIERVAEEERKAEEEKKKRAKLTQETALNIATSTLNSLSSIIGEETAVGKAAAVAAATIDTYKAANSAYASLASVPFVGPALGAAAAAAAVIAGVANVKKILSTKEDGSNATSVAVTPSITTPTVVTPPAVIEQVPLTRTLTSASEEERLNQMASPQRVYVVYDDIAQAGHNVQVQQAESTF